MSIKITRSLLDNYRKTKRDIGMLQMEIEYMETIHAGLRNSSRPDDGHDHSGSLQSPEWNCDNYKKRLKTLEQKKKEVEAVNEWIDAIEDVEARCVFRMFYIEAMSWVNIAKKTGCGLNADYPRKMIRDKYLKQQKII